MEQISDIDEQKKVRLEKLLALQKSKQNPFEIVRFDKTHHSTEIIDGYQKLEKTTVSVAGRVVLKRVMGKASFVHIQDQRGKIQIYIAVDEVGEPSYALFKDWDLGDIIGVTGFVFKTKTGEISVHAKKIDLLCKSLNPLPDKYHGLKDNEIRFRERYVDLIANPEVKDIFVLRTKVIKSIREFLDSRGFLECETPILQNIAGGAEARPFITHHNTLNMDMYLRIATELHLKRLVVGGFERVYELGRIFRNEGISYKHNPEFTTLELYQAYTDVVGMMDLTENMFKYVFKNTLDRLIVNYEGNVIDIGNTWRRVPMSQIVRETTGIDFNKLAIPQIIKELEKFQLGELKNKSWGDLLYLTFDQVVEKTLVQPTFVLDYPVEVSPLAKRKKDDPRLTERFEMFMCGREMANAFSELNDPIDQRARFEEQMKQRAAGNDEAHMLDEDFLNAIEYGLPPAGGLGVGIDRLIMIVTGVHSIRECLLFPTMKAKP
ncbi:MAG: lysine--tRNA ligase [Christensenellaceae bacterium]|jgi:lysyl-tRNA synthetase class 2|nr:lysine--tRNA ligase [Christensenellaceae bacterium]